MDSSWRGPQSGSGAIGDSSMESGDWRAQLQADSRQRIVNKIMDTLKRHLPYSGHEGLQELKKIAVRLEEKIYTAATSQSDYLRKIALKMLTMETRSQNPMPDAMQANSGANSVNPSDSGMQQVNCQGQPLPIAVPSNQGQQLLQQTMHNNMGSTGIQGFSSLSSALPPGTGSPQSIISNGANQNPNMQNIQNIQQNFVGNTMGPNNFENQRQIPGRQQQLAFQQQQSQNNHYAYQQQLQQIAKQKLQVQQGNIAPSMQQIQQQQNMLQQPSVMQPTMMQSVQNQQSVVPQSSQPLMNHQQQSALRQQRQVQVQPTLSNPMGKQQQLNATNMEQIQLMGQQNNMYSEMQQMQQMLFDQQNNLIGQHNNLSASLYPTAQTGNPNVGDWQEEMYQKIRAMKDLYLLDLNDLHQKILGKLQQHESLPQEIYNERIEKLKVFKNMLERFIAFLQIPKHNILANYKDKLSYYEKQIVHIITSNRPKPTATQKQPPPHKHSMQQSQQTHSASPLLAEFSAQGGNHDHCFAPKFLFFWECFFIFFFICYISIVLMYALVH